MRATGALFFGVAAGAGESALPALFFGMAAGAGESALPALFFAGVAEMGESTGEDELSPAGSAADSGLAAGRLSTAATVWLETGASTLFLAVGTLEFPPCV